MPASLSPPGPAPSRWKRLRSELFGSRVDGLISIALGAALVAIAFGLLKWTLFQAQWAVIQANSTLFAVGRYPIEQQWRLWLLTALLAAATGLSWGLLRALPRDQPALALQRSPGGWGVGGPGPGRAPLAPAQPGDPAALVGDHGPGVGVALGVGPLGE